MECRQIRANLQHYVSGNLPDTMGHIIDAHVRNCPACKRELQEWQEIFFSLEAPICPLAPKNFNYQVMTKIHEGSIQKRKSPLLSIWVYICAQPLQASLGVTLFFALLVLPLFSQFMVDMNVSVDTQRLSNMFSPVSLVSRVGYYASTLYATTVQGWATSSNTLLQNFHQLLFGRY